MNQTVRIYKDFEIHPLVYPHRPAGGQTGRNPRAGYDASVRICRAGTNGEVYRLPRLAPFEQTGEARLACISHAEQVIDGQVSGQSVKGL
ncbi:hypothetical protein QS306_15350 [Paraburkholderia bonniea]|uniref:hypothetical protein n=1 Tax=Paraburkholderia bonniea TaxID=2152891 RepID=UPI001292785D|nr:hypothetical protein [Paraburkholderia bonniea]WJF92131.1 hypothetical protein QS306_15350 [Paraburkholderia bonniea]WJF95451.1 hypothetical protein QS308_15355 [Paraburkholderia bonniea]